MLDTYPAAGVMATSPVTRPHAVPTALGVPLNHLVPLQMISSLHSEVERGA